MKKVVVRIDIQGEKEKQKAMKAVSSLSGIESIAVDMKGRKMTVVGDVDPIKVVDKLRKSWHVDIETVAKEETKDGGKKKSESEKIADLDNCYRNYNNPHLTQHYYIIHSAEENPNACVIC